jgi:hypothetical protein
MKIKIGTPTDSYEEKPPFHYNKALWNMLVIVEILLGLRFAFKFIGYEPNAGFAGIIYKVTQPFVSPFLKALGIYSEVGSVFEWTTLAAMFIYWIVVWIIVKIFLTDDSVLVSESEKEEK